MYSVFLLQVTSGRLLFATLFVAASVWANEKPIDFLDQPEPDAEEYRTRVASQLYVTPADCGRFRIDGDRAVSVYSSEDKEGQVRYWITCTTASGEISGEPGDADIVIDRKDAEIPETTGRAIRRVWQAMLERPFMQYSDDNPPAAVLDGRFVEFSLEVPNRPPLMAVLPPGEGHHGPRVRAFWKIAQALIQYCNAKENERTALASRIQSDANALVKSLE